MLRVAKPTSPMSMGTWILSAHSGLISAAAASDLTGRLGPLGTAAGLAASVTGPLLATYPGVLLANTAVPAWHTAYRELPLLFAGGAMTAAGPAAWRSARCGLSGPTSTPRGGSRWPAPRWRARPGSGSSGCTGYPESRTGRATRATC